MSWLEQELKTAMKRREPPKGFAERVKARVDAEQPGKRFEWRWIAAMAASLVLIVGGHEYRQEQQRREAERIQAEVRIAFQITQKKLELVRTHLSRFAVKGDF